MADAPDTLADIRRDLAKGLTLIEDKADTYAEREAYYLGTRRETSGSAFVRKLIAKDESHPISLAHIPVDATLGVVRLTAVDATEAAASAFLRGLFDADDYDDEADDWHTRAAYFGDYYVIIDPTEEDARGRAVAFNRTGSSPLTTVVVYSDRDQRTKLYGVKRWRAGKAWKALVYYDDLTVKLVTDETTSSATATDFSFDVKPGEDIDTALVLHDGGRMLIEHLAIDGKPYGRPVHGKAFGPQDAITKISAANLVNVEGQGLASRWALADPLAEIDDDIDDDFGTDGPDTTADKADGRTTATTTGRVRTIPGAIALLKGVRSVGQFAATGTDDFLKNLDWYVRVMAVACGIPLFEFDVTTGEQPSGESRRRARSRMIEHAGKIVRAATNFHKGIADTTLAAAGLAGSVTVSFRPLETETDKDGLELVSVKVKAGVPLKQALIEAGYDATDVEEWYPGDTGFSPDLLTVIAEALAKLGNARTLGVITDEELREMLPTVLTAARNEAVAPAAIPGVVTAAPVIDADADEV